ncbi:hypothetical protein [Sulfitobacter sp.]|uniref:hypothetical protein n=1 Tax=Sulfitobacter sp. TaxID=1903071 RepID=UPI0030014C20
MPPEPRKHAIVYYSRDGHTHRLARQLADTLEADLFRIVTSRYSSNVLGYLHAGFDSLTGWLPSISPIPDLSGYASVSLGAPIWTSYPGTPLRTYLATRPKLPDIVGMFATSGGNSAQDKAFSIACGTMDRPFVATFSVPNSLDQAAADMRVTDYCNALVTAVGTDLST